MKFFVGKPCRKGDYLCIDSNTGKLVPAPIGWALDSRITLVCVASRDLEVGEEVEVPSVLRWEKSAEFARLAEMRGPIIPPKSPPDSPADR
jgi:hypothetical protein